MTQSKKISTLFIVIICMMSICCVTPATAWKVSKITVNPEGTLIQGTTVIVLAQVDFPADDNVTFPSTNEFQFATDLTDLRWNYSLILDGAEEPQPRFSGRVLAISGWVLSKPHHVKESLILYLEGSAPAVQHTKNITILRIEEADGSCCYGCRYECKMIEKTAIVVNISDIQEKIKNLDERNRAFRSHIEEKVAMGVDATSAAEKYNLTECCLSSTCDIHEISYSQDQLTFCNNTITEGETLLDKAWAEKTVADAEIQITKANDKIDAIHANLSRPFDERLTQSYLKLDLATADIALAKNNISQSDFPQARIHAYTAYDEANASYYEALDTQKRMANPLNSAPVSVAVPLFAMLGVACILRWRNRG
jgi:hypothetical protein